MIFGITLSLSAQTITKVISEETIGFLTCKHAMYIEDDDTTYYISNLYQNREYTTITDIAGLIFYKQSDIDSLIINLNKCLTFIGTTDATVRFDETNYSLVILSSWKNALFIYDNKNKHTIMKQKHLQEWIQWLSSIKLPK